MLLALALSNAHATVPEGRTELVGDFGLLHGQFGLAAGVGSAIRRGPAVVVGTATVAARSTLCRDDALCLLRRGSQNPAAGPWSVAAALDTAAGDVRFGLVALVDGSVLDIAEQGCRRGEGCRHSLWLGSPDIPLGLSFAPAGGLRIAGTGASGTPFAATLAVQPTLINDIYIPIAPRMDLVIGLTRDVSLHWWAGRYGMVLGMGYRLNRPPEG